jgi:tRNA (Thr-GGU) A37 N-methylase
VHAVNYIYDSTSKLRIPMAGLDARDGNPILDVGLSTQESLENERDFRVTKDDQGLLLRLLPNRR